MANGKDENEMRKSLLTLVVVLLSGNAGTAVAQNGSAAGDWGAMTVTQEKLPDNTVCLGKKDNGWDFLHTCVIVRTVQSESSADVTTTVMAAR